MTNEGPFDYYQFVVSSELLKLLEWLIDYEHEGLKKLIKRAVEQGLIKPNMPKQQAHEPEEIQQNIVEFFTLLDILLQETIQEQSTQELLERSLIPAINCFDKTMYDSTTMATSIAKAAAVVDKSKGETPKEVLCKELLKRWKPHKKIQAH